VKIPIDGPETPAFGGKIKIKWKGEIQLDATVGDGKLPVTITVDTAKGLGGKAVQDWWHQKGAVSLGSHELLITAKFETEEAANKEKVTVKAKYTIEVPVEGGSLSVGVFGTVVEWNYKSAPTVGAVGISVKGKCPFKDQTLGGVPFTKMSISVQVSAEIAPNYLKIIMDEVVDGLKQAGKGIGETILTEAAFEAAITAGLAAVAVGTVLGVVDMFVQHANLKNMGAELAAAIRDIRGGLYDGLANRSASGSGDLYKAGYDIGKQGYQNAVNKIVASGTTLPPPDEIQAEAEAAAKKAAATWSGLREIEDKLRWGAFKKWVDENHGLGTFVADAQAAVQMCWGGPPEPENGEHMKYWVDRSLFMKGLKKAGLD